MDVQKCQEDTHILTVGFICVVMPDVNYIHFYCCMKCHCKKNIKCIPLFQTSVLIPVGAVLIRPSVTILVQVTGVHV